MSRPSSPRLDNGAVVWAIALAGVLAFDAALVRAGYPSLSEHAGRHPAITATGLGYMTLHLTSPAWLPDGVKRLDPLAAAARKIKRS